MKTKQDIIDSLSKLRVTLGGERLYVTPMIVNYNQPRKIWFYVSNEFAPSDMGGADICDLSQGGFGRQWGQFSDLKSKYVDIITWWRDFKCWFKGYFSFTSPSSWVSCLKHLTFITRPNSVNFPYLCTEINQDYTFSLDSHIMVEGRYQYIDYTPDELMILYIDKCNEIIEASNNEPNIESYKHSQAVLAKEALHLIENHKEKEICFICELDT